jgi:hypothetical protein
VRESVSSDYVGVEDGGTTTSDHGPDTAFRFQDGELDGGTGGSIELLDVGPSLMRSRPKGANQT